TVGGAGIVVLPMVLMGAVMAVATPDLASAKDPVSFIGELLPAWISVPYLLIALVGMLLINAMSMYSAGFTAQTLGINVPRAWAVSVNAVISLVFGFLLMVVATSFIGSFISFLTLLAVAFSAWIGVFGVKGEIKRGFGHGSDPSVPYGHPCGPWSEVPGPAARGLQYGGRRDQDRLPRPARPLPP
ncbi:cytosine permease, partial [Streptomyces sp. NPDC005180]|uniref:cytosine permease n=1 Tax=Streptomyces sp. NPDC005180 TaxID=3156868 RepID=UPI0033AD37F1